MTLLDPAIWTGKIFDGRWSTGSGGVFDVTEPATGATLGALGRADAGDVAKAAAVAARAQRDWAGRPHPERAAVLRRAGLLFEEHAEEIAGWIVREAGSIRPKAELETQVAVGECHEAAALPSLPQGRVLASGLPRWSMARRRPTVLADVTPSMPAYAQEVFGPVAPVVPFSTVEEAIALARDSEYGLSLGVLGDVGAAMRIADAVPTGLVHINDQTVNDEPNIPFGGTGASGTGSRLGGPEANIEAFTETQWVTMRPEIAPYPF
jgi:benzaldehyde dehydrogenase (NAD)